MESYFLMESASILMILSENRGSVIRHMMFRFTDSKRTSGSSLFGRSYSVNGIEEKESSLAWTI
ncbi:hypothetical protein J0A71_03g05140 [Encephalitozoon cuniculi]|nr:hypothetical protein J0A71_03g05140 [Encephalitozoon cuniculi]